MFIAVIRQSTFSFNFWFMYKNCYFRLKKSHISWYCVIFPFCFGTGIKLVIVSHDSRYAAICKLKCHYTKLHRIVKQIYTDKRNLHGQWSWELCPSFIRIWGFPFQRLKNSILLLIWNVDQRAVLVNQYSYSCNNQVPVLVLTHITNTRTCAFGTRPSPDVS